MKEENERIKPCVHIGGGLVCDSNLCRRCGFNPKENLLRKEYVRIYGLTKTKNGHQLVIERQRRLALELSLFPNKDAFI